MKWSKVKLGRSVEGRAIDAWVNAGRAERTVLVLGGMHGDEPKSVKLAQRFVEFLNAGAGGVDGTRWVIVPVVNPDGYERRKRRNALKVDINRNFSTLNWSPGSKRSRMYGGPKPASEPETQAVIRAVERYRPRRIITIHSIGLGRFCNNYDGPGRALAMAMKKHNRYPVTASIGYPTPGSFGSWAGRERRIPVVTLELPSLGSAKRCWEDNREALLACGQW